ncbi:hypothetical protein COCCADRAFT_30414 [Bipolaris zeicola 26-R-13]|uniref:NACHT domain-containing protein n=1 Tax=Cochliobolus carbonum (strain 26-R-13) TaxID=930089 RepID=W6XSM5_COCC2|nr:uncharacterized protein COCCADRAFT_30414 [Bipolaris zeicola 26-R-13]EUC28300.1 hypothetical protein COCCADRAFT_30414 [Bipolaris zeicola 26-R-13]
METQTAKQSTSTDLGRLWTQAISDYNARTGEDLSSMGAQSLDGAMKSLDDGMEKFKGFRHNGSKTSKFRSVIGNSLGDMQKCIDGIAVIGSAAGAFPPAMPVGLVFTAASRLISAFAGVKADYDRVESFFEYSGRFFERLSLLEERAESGPLAIAVVRVFSMQLSVCGRVRYLIKKKRFSQWLNALWNMEDQELLAAFAAMQASIDELNQTVGYETYNSIRTVQDEVKTGNDKLDAVQEDTSANAAKLDELDEKLRSFRSSLGQDVQQLYMSSLKLEVVVSEGFVAVQTKQNESHTLLLQLQKSVEKLGKTPEHDEKKKQSGKSKGDSGDRKFQALREIKKFLTENYTIFPSWTDAHKENLAQDEDMRDSQVKHTAKWLNEHPDFKTWAEGGNSLLWIRGDEGIGKSFLAFSAVQGLRALRNEKNSFAYFYFKEEHPYLQSVQNAFASAALQIAESNNKYAEQVAANIRDNAAQSEDISTWERFFISMFPGKEKSDSRLFLVLDGLDEAHIQQGGIMTEFLSDLRLENANVSVLLTSRPEEKPIIQLFDPSVIDVTKQEIKPDIKALVKSRLHSLPRVRKFSHAVKRAITRKVVKQADSMLYAEHVLRRFSYIGRERAVLEELEKMPDSLHDLYKLLLDECRHNRSDAQYQALKKLFAWLAFSKRSLSLAEASNLVQLTLSDNSFDIEEEIIGRSSRILELTQTRQTEEDTKEDDKEDDETDDTKDDFVFELGYRESPLSFQDRSLRQYFKSVSVDADGTEEFRTPASAAHLTILQMCADIMIKAAKDPEDQTSSGVSLYAIQYWYEHLKELDVEKSTDATICQVVTLLYSITQNTNNVAKLFEERARHAELYPERADDTPSAWFDTLLIWAAKASSFADESLDSEVKEWARTVNKDNVLLLLAKGHVQNWLDARTQWWIPETFRFVKAALRLANRLQTTDDEPIKLIQEITSQYDVPAEDYKTLRAIGATLCDYGYDYSDAERQKAMLTEGASYLKQAVERMECDNQEKIETLRLLAPKYLWIDQHSEAIKYYDQAYDMLPDPDSEGLTKAQQIEFMDIRLDILTAKASAFEEMKQSEDALCIYNEARRFSGETPLPGARLDDITLLFKEENDPDGSKLIKELKTWTEKERNNWFQYCFEGWVDNNAVTRMQRAAKLTGETDLLLGWLYTLAKTLPEESYYLFNVRGAIANLYYPVMGDIEKGKALRQEILSMNPKPESWFEETMNEKKTEHRLKLAQILFHEFQNCSDPTKKEALIETLRTLPSAHVDDDLQESHVGMLLANMLRIMGPAKEYQKHMNDLFSACMHGLEDSVSWNDSSSLRLLSKVLGSLDGLERDAKIACTAQFSILDRSVHYQNSGTDVSETDSNGDSTEEDAENKSGEEVVPIVETATSDNDPVTDGKPAKNGESDLLDGQLETVGGSTTDSAVAKRRDSAEVAEAPQQTGEAQESTSSEQDATEADPNNLDEDLTGSGIFCDGGCGTDMSSWVKPIYYCLVCVNCDLCEDCHSKRLAQTRGEIAEPWHSYCGRDHRYIKAPMKGWKGVKDGIIRIDGEEDLSVRDWLKGLKEERWQKAWEMFWTRQGGLRNIGIDD